MCGICGFATYKQIESKDLESMNATLRHRGPDDEGTYLINKNSRNIGLAHKRLSILDLSELGHQPMLSRDGQIAIVFNGEIYNYLEIRAELKGLGCKFVSNCDTEVIIAAYKEWGIKCLDRFDGMFAIAIYDNSKDIIFLARDRLGKKPLYYYNDDGDFVFASEIKPILKFKYFKKDIELESVYKYFAYQYIPSPLSIFKNVYKLLPGSYLEYGKDKIVIRKYWDIVDIYCNNSNKSDMNEEECLDMIENTLRRSVGYRMISDVPLGAFLSGGIDSSLVVLMMAQMSRMPVKTFSIGFNEMDFDEARYAAKIASYIGTEHNELYLDSREILPTIRSLPDFYDEPFADLSSVPTYLISTFAKQKVTVALSGDGGDELFCGYETYEFIKKRKSFFNIPWIARRLLFPYISQILGKESLQKYANRDIISLHRIVMGTSDPSLLTDLLYSRDYGFNEDRFTTTYKRAYPARKNVLESIMLVDINTYLSDCILTKVDRASMGVSLELRCPILDYKLVELSQSIPIDLKYKNGVLKYPLKKILSRYISQELFMRPKQGFDFPFAEWLKSDLKPLVDEYINADRIKKQGIFNPDTCKAAIDLHISGKQNNAFTIWELLMFQIWYEKYMN